MKEKTREELVKDFCLLCAKHKIIPVSNDIDQDRPGYIKINFTAEKKILEGGDKPNPEEIKVFLSIFERLAEFEASQRLIRGSAVFERSELPIPEVMKVINWLDNINEENK